MPWFHVFLLALVQGITEFLPISSSGHLVAIWEGLDAAGVEVPEKTLAQRLTIDVAVHVGTLLAICIYFRSDIRDMIVGVFHLTTGRVDAGARLTIFIVVSFIPIALAGLFFKDAIVLNLHDIEVVAWATIGFGIVLYLADRAGMTLRRIEHMTVLSAVLIGLSQILALIPGTSRSGVTMSMARILGFERPTAARFSMLMSVPAIAAAGILVGADLVRSGNLQVGLDALVAAVLSFLFALAAIAFLMAWLRRWSFTPFVVYRLVLGAGLLYWVYGTAA